MRKRCIAGILAGLILFSLVACGSKENSEPDAPVSVAGVTQAPDENPEPTSEAKPTQGEVEPTQDETKPSQGEAEPTQGEAKPNQADPEPTQDEANPTQGEVEPTQDETKPSQGEAEPTQGETKPSQGEAEPTQDETKPNQGEAEPTQDETKPTQGEAEPTQDETKPTQGEAEPTQDETKPSQGEAEPTQDETKPTQADPEPTQAESEPSQPNPQPTSEAKPSESESDSQKTPTIQSVFAGHGMKAGTCLTTQMISKSYLADLITANFNSVTMENSMKPDYILDRAASIASGDLVVKFNADMAMMLDWARANHMAVRGHTIIWHSQTPKWIFHENFDTNAPFVTRQVMLERMESYIKQVFEQLDEYGYTDLFYAYDVVNEAWMEDGKIRGEMNYWYQIIGEDYLWYAFYYADQYAPESIDLYYNDYNEQYKTDALLKFVETLVDEEGNYLIDGIGLQAHLYTGDDLGNYLKTVERLGATGLKIELTELDVSLGTWQNTLAGTDANLKMQGRYYYELVGGLFALVDEGKINMDALTFWGFADGLSWRKNASPLLYDTTYFPKYALYGVLQDKEKAGY